MAADGAVDAREVQDGEAAHRNAPPGAVVTRGRSAGVALAESVPLVGAPSFWSLGQRGAGQVIAVIDTGVAPSFGGTLVGQACFAATQQGQSLVGHCGPSRDEPSAFSAECFDLGVCGSGLVLDAEAGRPCDEPASPKDCAHGTAVAAVAARHDAPEGVAPDAGVYAIQVFNTTGRNADFVDILLALEHVADLADAGMDIAAANLSLSSSATYPTHCDSGGHPDPDALAFRAVIGALERRGIPTIAATGNDAHPGSIGLPACVSNAIAVGASDLDDDIADFSNRGPTTDLVAPGADEGNGAIDRLDIPGSPVPTWAGTSFAAPHVAGAFALLGTEYPSASVPQRLAHLRSTGAPATDPVTGATYPRLLLRPPAQALPGGVLFPATDVAAGTARGAVGDFDGDGRGDVLAHAPGGAPDRIAYGTSRWALSARTYPVAGTYLPVVGNFRGDDADDILWYAPGAPADRLWIGRPTRSFGSVATSVAGVYTPLVGDFDGDGYDDIAWYAPGAAADSLWYGGATSFSPRSMGVAGTYRVAVGDFDGDSRDDLVWHAPGTVADSLWRGTASRGTFAKSSLTINGTNVMRAGDVDGDDDDDLLLYRAGTASDAIWRGGPAVGSTSGTGGFAPLAVTVNGTYVPSIGDLNADGRDDIVWYAAGPATDVLWFGQPTGSPTGPTFAVTGSYAPLLTDLDADGGSDIVWFQAATSTTPVWWTHLP